MSVEIKAKSANPGPLGLLGFGMTTVLLNLHNAGLLPLSIVIVAMGIALGIAIFDLMPLLGTGGVLLPWALIALIMQNYFIAIGVFLLYLVITAVRNSLEPRIVGNQIGLHPLATLIAMILGLELIGLVGMMLFPITLVAITNLKKQSETEGERK